MQNIRSAALKDAKEILEIYSPYIKETAISFETAIPSLNEMEERIGLVLIAYPWLVYESDGCIVGYAYASAYKSRCAYSWSVESSIYIKAECHGKGIGKLLYSELLERLIQKGIVNVIAGISLPNESSIRLHEKFGFQKVAHFKNVGFKLGKWWDVGYWQLQLQKPDIPKEII